MSSALLRELNVSKDAFLRQLREAIGDGEITVAGTQIDVSDSMGKVSIEVSEKPGEPSSPDQTPTLMVGFTFDGMSDEQVRYFMERFDAYDFGEGDRAG